MLDIALREDLFAVGFVTKILLTMFLVLYVQLLFPSEPLYLLSLCMKDHRYPGLLR